MSEAATPHVLVAYFSHAGENWVSGGVRYIEVGNTKRLAETIANKLESRGHRVDRYEIKAKMLSFLLLG